MRESARQAFRPSLFEGGFSLLSLRMNRLNLEALSLIDLSKVEAA